MKIFRDFLCSCLFGEDYVSEDMYLGSFMKCFSTTESSVVEHVLSRYLAVDDEDVQDFLTALVSKKIATNESFKESVVEIAHKELVQKPRYVAYCRLDVLHLLKPLIMSTDGLFHMYESLHPSTHKVCKIVKADSKTGL